MTVHDVSRGTRPPTGFQLGGQRIVPPVILAPMAGVSDSAFRATCMTSGCPLAFTEVVSAAGLVYNSGRTRYLLECADDEHPVVAHLYGHDPRIMAEAAETIASLDRFAGIDVNCGCPVRRITARGSGVALMREPELVGDIVRAVRSAVDLPVTVKTRLGIAIGDGLVGPLAAAVERAGADALIVHARYAEQHHRGDADWDALAALKRERDIRVVGNGGIDCAADAPRMLAATGVDAVMVGRAAWGRPWFFRDAAARMQGAAVPEPPTWEQRQRIMEAHFQRLLALREKEHLFRKSPPRPPPESASLAFRPHLLKYLSGSPAAGMVRRSLNDIRSPEALHDVLRRALHACV